MNDVQVTLDQRPVAIDPNTKIMFPDGIFIRSINAGIALMRVKFPNPFPPPEQSIYYFFDFYRFENAESDGINILNAEPNSWKIIPRRQPYLYWMFYVDLSGASIGKHKVTFRIKHFYGPDPWFGPGGLVEYTGEIYITDANFDIQNFKGSLAAPEGHFSLSINGVQLFQKEPIKGRVPCKNKTLFLPKDFYTRIDYVTPYDTVNGPLLFNDPWWKIAGVIVAVIAGLVAGIWALGGLLGWWDSPIEHVESGAVDPETGQACRECRPAPANQGYTSVQADPIWGAFLTAAALGAAVAKCDLIDPYRRGEDGSPPAPADQTKAESLRFTLDYIQLPLPGTPYRIGVDWQFTRHGLQTPDYPPVSSRDEVENIHFITGYTVRTADGQTEYPRHSTQEISLVVDLATSSDYARYKKEIGKQLRKTMPEFYIYGHMRHREQGSLKSTIFVPSGSQHIGCFKISVDDSLGDWDIMILIQNVNNAKPDLQPDAKAQVIGGYIYSKNFSLQHDPETDVCLISPNWDLSIKLV